MKVLIAEEKHGNRIFDISTEEKREKAYMKLFRERDREGEYGELRDLESDVYKRAKAGSGKDAIRLLRSRIDYEYERLYEEETE